ncbi:MAG TPA: FtsX-like permease family protein, partial [Burkholderiaceae bacterium]|nr:FtsX-like permease family protein [Burkholderiaceae bacterium]
VTLWTDEAVDDVSARLALARLPGVTMVESVRFVPVTFRHGHISERSMIRGYAPRPELYRVIDSNGRQVLLEGRGLILTDRLAEKLRVRVGDTVQAVVMTGAPRTLELTVSATVSETMGLNAYMDRPSLNRALGESDLSSGFVLGLERGREAQVLEATKSLPRSAGAFSKATMLRNMEEISARNVRIMSTIMTVFAAVISVGVVYNNARIALAERGWELASLRVLGFTRGEVSALLLGEMAISIAIALPLGMVLGWGLTNLINELLKSDQFFFPVVIRASTYAWAAVCVLVADVGSALVVRRRIDRLDLVAVLKTRD